jgi:hypothetical protein
MQKVGNFSFGTVYRAVTNRLEFKVVGAYLLSLFHFQLMEISSSDEVTTIELPIYNTTITIPTNKVKPPIRQLKTNDRRKNLKWGEQFENAIKHFTLTKTPNNVIEINQLDQPLIGCDENENQIIKVVQLAASFYVHMAAYRTNSNNLFVECFEQIEECEGCEFVAMSVERFKLRLKRLKLEIESCQNFNELDKIILNSYNLKEAHNSRNGGNVLSTIRGLSINGSHWLTKNCLIEIAIKEIQQEMGANFQCCEEHAEMVKHVHQALDKIYEDATHGSKHLNLQHYKLSVLRHYAKTLSETVEVIPPPVQVGRKRKIPPSTVAVGHSIELPAPVLAPLPAAQPVIVAQATPQPTQQMVYYPVQVVNNPNPSVTVWPTGNIYSPSPYTLTAPVMPTISAVTTIPIVMKDESNYMLSPAPAEAVQPQIFTIKPEADRIISNPIQVIHHNPIAVYSPYLQVKDEQKDHHHLNHYIDTNVNFHTMVSNPMAGGYAIQEIKIEEPQYQ